MLLLALRGIYYPHGEAHHPEKWYHEGHERSFRDVRSLHCGGDGYALAKARSVEDWYCCCRLVVSPTAHDMGSLFSSERASRTIGGDAKQGHSTSYADGRCNGDGIEQ